MSYSRSEVGWNRWLIRRSRSDALQLVDQCIARRVDLGSEAGRAAGVGMDPGDQPAVGGANILHRRALADAEQRARLRYAHRRRRHDLPPPPGISDAGQRCEKQELDHQPAIAAWRGSAPAAPGPGKAKPAIISRSSWRAAMCDIATSSIS